MVKLDFTKKKKKRKIGNENSRSNGDGMKSHLMILIK